MPSKNNLMTTNNLVLLFNKLTETRSNFINIIEYGIFFLSDLPNNSKPGLLIISLRFFEIMADSQSSDNN